MFEIIENRGNGINYTVFRGTQKECIEWLDKNTKPAYYGAQRVNIDDTCVNGNGEPWTYTVEKAEE